MRRQQSGIYKIQSKIKPERIYIGSSVNITERWSQHIKHLSDNKHHSIKLQRHVLKYGIEDLAFSIIEPCFQDWLIMREQFYLDKLKPYFNIYTEAGSPLGIKRSEETKRKYSEARKGKVPWNKGKKATPEAIKHQSESRKGMKAWNKGKKGFMKGRITSEETKAKMRAVAKGRIISQEQREKTSNTLKGRVGKKLSEETKEKLRIINIGNKYNLGHKHSNETRQKISQSNKGKKGRVVSDEEKKKMSQRLIGNKFGVGNKNSLGYRFSDEAKQKMSERLKKEWILKKIKKQIDNQEVSICN